MKKNILLIATALISCMAWAQTATVQPKIMVIPYIKQGEDITQVIENDVNKRIVLAKIREAFDSRGFTTIDFAAKLKSLSRTEGLSQESQTDLKAMTIQQSGADIYVEAEMDILLSSSGNSVKTILTAYDISTGGSLANKVGESGKFYTDDIGKLGAKAVEKVADEFLDIIQTKFTDIVNNGRSISVDFSFEQTSSLSMSTEIGSEGLTLSDQIELWMSEHAYKNNYIVLNKGEKDGVRPDMGVITPNGVLGVVNAVSENACSVISILSNEISVSVKLEKADIFCIMSWNQKSSGGAVLVDIPPHIPVMAGDTVLTSGNSSVFPPDIPLGVVKSSKMGKRGFLKADVKLFENYRSVQFVSIARNNLKNEIDSLTGGGK